MITAHKSRGMRLLRRRGTPVRIVGMCLATVAVMGCAADGTKTGNGVQMEFAATGQALVQVDAAPIGFDVQDAQGTTFSIDEAVLIASEVELRAKGQDLCLFDPPEAVSCTNGRMRLREVMELDLLSPRTNVVLQDLEFPDVVYDRVAVRTQALDKDSARGPVSFFVSGYVTFDDVPRSFVLSLKRNETLRFENVDGVEVGSNQRLSAQLDLRALFLQLPLTECIEGGDVMLEQDVWMFTEDSKCKQIEQTFVDELRKSTRLRTAQR